MKLISCILFVSLSALVKSKCRDRNDLCKIWASEDYCTNAQHARYMRKDCKKSCGFCKNHVNDNDDDDCQNNHPSCDKWKRNAECLRNPRFMRKNCRRSCGLCIPPPNSPQTPGPPPIPPLPPIPSVIPCRDTHKSCAKWSKIGECKRNPKWMLLHCKLSCGQCKPKGSRVKSTPSPSKPTLTKGSPQKVKPTKRPPSTSTSATLSSTASATNAPKQVTKGGNGTPEKSDPLASPPPIPTAPPIHPYPPRPGDIYERENEIPEISSTLECGQRSKNLKALSFYRIVGGVSKGAGRWPWQVGLYLTRYQVAPYCGGTLIEADLVLTAAHCKPRVGTFVKLGDYNLRQEEGTEQMISVAEVFIHEDFSVYSHRNDIALLRLSESVDLGDYINTACLPKTKVKSGDSCFATGWGHIGLWNFRSATLREAKVPVVDRRYCNIRFRGRVSNTMMCAGYADGGIDACKGDSGGPLVCEKNGRFYLHGITSWGYGCGKAYTPGVYTDVSEYVKWIEKKSMKLNYGTSAPPKPQISPLLRLLLFGGLKK